MEAKIAAIDVRVENLENRLDKHEAEDDRFHKYNSHMLEDLIGKITKIDISAARFEADLVHRAGNDNDTKGKMQEINDKLDTVRRLVWMALGAVIVMAGSISVIGDSIMKALGAH